MLLNELNFELLYSIFDRRKHFNISLKINGKFVITLKHYFKLIEK